MARKDQWTVQYCWHAVSDTSRAGRKHMTLFREEVLLQRRQDLHGTISLALPLSWHVITLSLFAVLILILAFFTTATYSRIDIASGSLVPSAGILKVVPPRPGRVDEVTVAEGERVRKGAKLARIAVEQSASSSSGTQATVLDIMSQQQAIVGNQTLLSQQAAKSQQDEFVAHIAGLRLELTSIRRQIELQRSLLDLAQTDLERASAIASRGFISQHEIADRQERVTLRKQSLSALEQSRSAKLAEIDQLSAGQRASQAQAASGAAGLQRDRARVAQEQAVYRAEQGYDLAAPADGSISALAIGTLTTSAMATDYFVSLVAAMLEPTLSRAKTPMIEVSGGYDSSCVAIAAATLRRDLNSYAVIQQGAIGIQQRKRRQELVTKLGLVDSTSASDAILPFKSLSSDECTLTPFDDIYRACCVAGLESHPVKDVDLLITGIGGDELTMERTSGRETWEVNGGPSSSALDAVAGRSDMFMRRGIWLAQPLARRPVVDFCRALPASLRRGRMLNVLTLARAGLSDGFLFPRYAEHYGPMVQHEAATFDFDAAFDESIIADLGLADINSLMLEAHKATFNGFSLELVTRLWLMMKLEVI